MREDALGPLLPRTRESVWRHLWPTLPVVLVVLLLAYRQGRYPSPRFLLLLIALGGGVLLLRQPALGLPALVMAALAAPMQVGTGTDVRLNTVTLLVPVLAIVWVLDMIRRRRLHIVSSRVNLPLVLFLAANLLSLFIGRATWDPKVPVSGNFLLVQLAQWAILAFSAVAFWLAANLVPNETWLRRLVATFLLLGGGLAMLRLLPGVSVGLESFTTIALNRAPFWLLLACVAAGQLLFNSALSWPRRAFLLMLVGISVYYSFVLQREGVSNWAPLAVAMGLLFWLRFRRLRVATAAILIMLAVAGLLFPSLYEFAGGDAEWQLSGGSRMALSERVIQLTMRNPLTGLGPAAYRAYGYTGSLKYINTFYQSIALSSHNNYVDLFSHGGILGLSLFLWFIWEVGRLGIALKQRFTHGFAAGYVNGMLATGAGALVLMALADWILPFVYNIGFPGFQASVLVWLFFGGLVAVERLGQGEGPTP